MTHGDGGKGSGRRKEDASKVRDNWDRIFKKKELEMEVYEQDNDDDYVDNDDWCCDSCGGPMYRQAHWNYGQCDDCGARQELEDDF